MNVLHVYKLQRNAYFLIKFTLRGNVEVHPHSQTKLAETEMELIVVLH